MTKPREQLRLGLNLRGIGFHAAAWRHPDSTPERIFDVDYYAELARTAERGLFDVVFLADSLSYWKPRQNVLAWPLEPIALLGAIAHATERIGLVGTLSTTYNDPYDVARRLAVLDQVSQGRAGVNLVTSAGDSVARNFGYPAHPQHADRYRRANEFIEVLLSLWDSPESDIEHDGEFFQVHGALEVAASPQGRPVIVQAGASPDGRDLAGRFAEAVFAASSDIPSGAALYADLKARTVAHGRLSSDINVLPGVVPFVASTEAEAHRLYDEYEELVLDDGGNIARLGSELGIDLSQHDPEAPVPVELFPTLDGYDGAVTRLERLTAWARSEGKSLRRFANTVYRSLGVIHWTPVGSPEQIADEFERWFSAGTADGFNVLVPQHPRGLQDFVDHVIPVLQQRGLYRREYEGITLREHLGLSDPRIREDSRPAS